MFARGVSAARFWFAMLAVAALLAIGAPPAAANHPQPAHGDAVVFDHKTGNHWWVEVLLSGGASGSVTGVQAMDTNGPWVDLAKKSWGAWAASFHIEPGNQVRFRALWSGGDQATSCWFDHPSGTERCSASPPPPQPAGPWHVREVGAAGNAGPGDIAVGDADRDGRPNVILANGAGLTNFQWSGAQWIGRTITTAPFEHVVVGDGDNDGDHEVYASVGNALWQHELGQGGWRSTRLVEVAEPFAAGLVLANIDPNVSGNELYMAQDDGSSTWIHKVIVTPTPSEQPIAAIQQQATADLVAGDGDRDGRLELYWGTGRLHGSVVHQLDHVGHWQQTLIASIGSAGARHHIAVGDPDGGGNEVYVLSDHGSMQRAWFAAGRWQEEAVLTPDGAPLGFANTDHTALAFGDGDGDGNGELYFTTGDGRLARVEANPWRSQEVARPHGHGGPGRAEALAIADGDGDGVAEAYLLGAHPIVRSSGYSAVYQASPHALPQPWVVDFTGVRGNEWWVQVRAVGHGEAAAKVDVRIDGGTWMPLDEQAWGPPGDDWAKSYRVTQGRIVQFRATSATGATDLSDCHQWIPASGQDATRVTCPGGSPPPPPPPPPSGFEATFAKVKGNEWWVEVTVSGNQPVSVVEARVTCAGAWTPLAKTDWGSWAKSFRVAEGSKVDFRATSSTGAADVSDSAYIWPQATATTGCAT